MPEEQLAGAYPPIGFQLLADASYVLGLEGRLWADDAASVPRTFWGKEEVKLSHVRLLRMATPLALYYHANPDLGCVSNCP